MIKAILFDMGGVVCEYLDKERYSSLSKLSRDRLDCKVVKEKIKPYEIRFEKGKISPASFWKLVANSLIIADRNKIKKVWITNTGRVDRRMIQLVKKLGRGGYKMGILSNTNKVAAGIHKKRGDYDLFSPLILSYEVGYRKPQNKIYQIALKKLKVKSEECVYIDDKENKFPQRKMGIKTILFKNPRQLENDLKKMDIL